MKFLKQFCFIFIMTFVFLKSSDSDDDFVDMEEALQFVEGDDFFEIKQESKALNHASLNNVTFENQRKIAQANSELLDKIKAETRDSFIAAENEKYKNHRIFLKMWLQGGSGGRYISPFSSSENLIREIDAYCSLQGEDFCAWYRECCSRQGGAFGLLEELKHEPILENGNSFVHELIDRQNIDWLYSFGVENINGDAKNKNGKTVLEFLKNRGKHAEHHEYMVKRLILIISYGKYR